MTVNEYQNFLKFSRKDNSYNRLPGILNQNPIIVTKKEAYNFSYTDVNKLRLAQLLAKRDIATNREIEACKIQEEIFQKSNEPESINKSKLIQEKFNGKLCRQPIKIKPQRERVSSVKRVPGPQTPNKISLRRTIHTKNVLLNNMPVRSVSPPTRDTDNIWTPRKANDVFVPKESEMEKLSKKLELCTSKLDELEKNLIAKSKNIDHNINLNPQFNSIRPIKSSKEIGILSNKLQQLLNSNIASNQDVIEKSGTIPPPIDTVQPPNNDNINYVLSKLDHLVSDIDIIQSRWSRLNYETVSDCNDNHEPVEKEIRFTKIPTHEDMITEGIEFLDKDRLELNVPRNLVVKLDKNRTIPTDIFKFKGMAVKLNHIDWLADDFVDDLVEAVVNEIDEANNHLVENILHEELLA